MSWDSVTAKKKNSYICGFVCTNCNSPIITRILIEAEATKSAPFITKKVEQEASDVATNTIKELLLNLQSFSKTGEPFAQTKIEEETFSLVIKGEIRGLPVGFGKLCGPFGADELFNCICPHCEAVKVRWKKITILGIDLEPNEVFSVFESFDEAKLWALNYLERQAKIIGDIRQDKELINAHRESYITNQIKLNEAQAYINLLSERIELEELNKKRSDLSTKRYLLKPWNIKEKKVISSDIDIIDANIEKLKQYIKDAEAPYIKIIEEASEKSRYDELIAYGLSGEITAYKATKGINIAFVNKMNPPLEEDDKRIKEGIIRVKAQQNSEHLLEIPSKETNDFIYCRKCGDKILSDSAFCPKCGEQVVN